MRDNASRKYEDTTVKLDMPFEQAIRLLARRPNRPPGETKPPVPPPRTGKDGDENPCS